MIIIEKIIHLTDEDNQTNIHFPFNLDKTYSEIIIYFSYSPAYSRDQVAIQQIKSAIDTYIPDNVPNADKQIESYLPVENFITISLSTDKKYIGNHHNKKKEQIIRISQDGATHGFWPTRINEGFYEIQLNCHCIASESVTVDLKVEVK